MGDESVLQTQKFPLLSFYKEGEAKTCVFWDLNDYPIPSGVNPGSMCEKIKDAIWEQGIDGDVSIHAYVDVSEREYGDAGFQLEVFPECEGGKHTRHSAMLADMAIWAVINPKPCNVFILAKVTDDFLATHLRSCCTRIYGQGRAPAQSGSTFLTCIFDFALRRRRRRPRRSVSRR
ncbi:unnamed protein product [Microthlaspi erraticum]|uniref:NYN domain-containing protein n=1 Tax=Microthlaspi erraticum TaxID=1685480 RepID=A0A6D2J2C4_9BRAS|nr:unnamed protein product [Microthlaspi erraticum]